MELPSILRGLFAPREPPLFLTKMIMFGNGQSKKIRPGKSSYQHCMEKIIKQAKRLLLGMARGRTSCILVVRKIGGQSLNKCPPE